MPREIDISNVERSFILEALEQGIRVDGRPLDQFRNIDLKFGDEYGIVTLRLGKTRLAIPKDGGKMTRDANQTPEEFTSKSPPRSQSH